MSFRIPQPQRIVDLLTFAVADKHERYDFLNARIGSGRTPSSIEEELWSMLPPTDSNDQEEVTQKAGEIAKRHGIALDDRRIFDVAEREDPEFGKRLKTVSVINVQNMLQANFYRSAWKLFELGNPHKFSARYDAVTQVPITFDGKRIAVVETYSYGHSTTYRAVLYHLMRHIGNLAGDETESDVKYLARKAFDGKRVLELGCGPGFFLYLLRELGADIVGVEKRDTYRDQTDAAKLSILYGDAEKVTDMIRDKKFDVVFSRNFLSLHVTVDKGPDVMEAAYGVTNDGGLSFHLIDYRKTPEEEYMEMLRSTCESTKLDYDTLVQTFSMLPAEKKDALLRRNVLNTSIESLTRIGYRPLTSYLFDAEENISIAARK
ncbi:MAG: class I SAM-dependent methyltransferase [Candidatus Aenigmatarchaeota archaeon]